MPVDDEGNRRGVLKACQTSSRGGGKEQQDGRSILRYVHYSTGTERLTQALKQATSGNDH